MTVSEKTLFLISDLFKDKWTQAVTLSIAILAVCAAISGLKASSYSTKVALYSSLENKGWAFYQAKNIKQHISESQRDLYLYYVTINPSSKASDILRIQMAFLEKEIVRYDAEKNVIKKETEALAIVQNKYKEKSADFALATMLLHVCIMLSSVSTLTEKKSLWGIGMAFGVSGLIYMCAGLWL